MLKKITTMTTAASAARATTSGLGAEDACQFAFGTFPDNRKRCELSERSGKSSKPESAAKGSRFRRAKVATAAEQFAGKTFADGARRDEF